MKKWLIFRHLESGQFRQERLFDEETYDQVQEEVPVVQAGGVPTSRQGTFVRILRGDEIVQKYEGEVYDLIETNEKFRHRDLRLLMAKLNGVVEVMEG